MDKNFEIRFGKSSSNNYNKAINIAKKFSDFTQINEKTQFNIIQADNEEIYNKYSTFEKLYLIISGWKSTLITYKNKEIKPYDFFNKFNQIIRCSKDYENSVVKDVYCNQSITQQGWGCKYLIDIKRHLDDDGYYYSTTKYWYRYGNFESENKWVINKPLLLEHLKKEAEKKYIEHCPVFSLDKLKNIVEELPDSIEVEDNPNWEVEYSEDFVGTTIQRKPIGIKHISENKDHNRKHGFGISFQNLIEQEKEDVSELQRFIPEVTFNDIGGIENIIDQIREVIELPLKKPEIFEHFGIKPHKGILLYGEPGNGKTLVAKAIANEVKAHFIPISGPELISKWHGESEENLRNIFKEARELEPSIIFFDEIDSVAQKRADGENARLDAKFVNQLLTLMDGMEAYENVTILASTNRPELLDDALLRPGRFDYKIEIEKPDEIGCLKILKVACSKMPLDKSVILPEIANKLLGSSGAEIVFVAKEAAINSLKRTIDLKELIISPDHYEIDLTKLNVENCDFEKAIDKLKENQIDDE